MATGKFKIIHIACVIFLLDCVYYKFSFQTAQELVEI